MNPVPFYGYLIDVFFGDPPGMLHPVIYIGKFIKRLENFLYRENDSKKLQLAKGAVLWFLTVGTTFVLSLFLLKTANYVSPYLGFAAEILMISTCVASRGLDRAAGRVAARMREGNLEDARRQVGEIVGRDTENLEEKEIARAAIETVGENIVDAVTSPVFFAFIGGAPLAMAYRAVNTLDSMVGYKNERYLHFGRFSARADDLFNFIPARLTSLFILFSALILPSASFREGLRIFFRDRKKHPSPNGGYSESIIAGSLGIRLGGYNSYFGKVSFRPYMGDESRSSGWRDITMTVRIMYLTGFLFTLFPVLISYLTEI